MSRRLPLAPLIGSFSFFAAIVALSTYHANAVTVDTWYMLVSGREIAAHGLPQHDHLAVLTAGRTWVDQQWLGQWLYYEVYRLGGWRLVDGLHLLLYLGGFVFAAAAARRSGVRAWPLAIAFAASICILVGRWAIRTEDFSVLLFGVVLYLICRDRLRHDRLILVALPVIGLWANLHGVALLAAGLLVLYGASIVIARPGTALLLLVSPLALLVVPYAPAETVGYYRTIVGGYAARHLAAEWQAPTLSQNVSLFVSVIAVAALVGAFARKADAIFPVAALALFGYGALSADREVIWFALTVMALTPPLIDAVAFRNETLTRIAGKAATVSLLFAPLALAACVLMIAAPTAPPAVAGVPLAPGKLFVTSSYADQLLWQHPELRGRVAFDIRWELLTKPEAIRLARTFYGDPQWAQGLDGYRFVITDSVLDVNLNAALTRSRDWRRVEQNSEITVYRRVA